MKSTSKNIAFLVPYPLGISPGQRFRFEHYLPALRKSGFQYRVFSFLSENAYKSFFKGGLFVKAGALLAGYFKRAGLLFTIHRYDFIYVYRETSPIGPPLLLWLNRWIWRKPVIYDFDDAIWLRDEGGESSLVASIKWKSKVGTISRWAEKVNVGNRFLADYVTTQGGSPVIIPTVVDTSTVHVRKNPAPSELIIGWTGSHSTLKFITPLLPVLRSLREKYEFNFHIIANSDPGYQDSFIKFIPWSKESEINDLEEFHIGVMPLQDNNWSKGKCGFKAIQYLSLATPAVVSPVGVNTEVVRDGIDGFQAETESDWHEMLEKLIVSEQLRTEMGRAGREHIVKDYSVDATREKFLSLF